MSREDNGTVELETTGATAKAMDAAHDKNTERCCCCTIFDALMYWTGCVCCCCDKDSMDEHGLDDIVEDRFCTDVPFCLAFIMALIAQLVLFIVAINQGADPRWIIYYSDWEGNLCAPDESAGNRAAWPDIRIYSLVICVDSCNDTVLDPRIITPNFNLDIELEDINYVNGTFTIDYSGYETESFFGAYCLPTLETFGQVADATLGDEYEDFIDKYYETIDQLGETLSLALDDLYTMRWLFLLCGFTAFIVSLIWGFLIRSCGALMVWTSIIFTLFGVIIIAYYMIDFSQTAYALGYTTIGDIMYYGGIVLAVGDGCFFLAICFMWHRIRLAIALAKETTRALSDMWTLFFYPSIPFVAFVLYSVYWLVAALYMGSVTVTVDKELPLAAHDPEFAWFDGAETACEALGCEPDPDDGKYYYKKYEVDENWQYVLLYHFFVFLWVTQFIIYHTYLVLAGVYAEWYFTDWKDHPEDEQKWYGEGKRRLSRFPVIGAFYRATRYHTGSLALGSLLIAIIEFTEYTLTYIEKRSRNGEPSPLQTAVICLIKCLLKCLKCILDRINRNGYIITAITGWPFCRASMKGISITFKNIVRSAALNMVSGYLENLGKIAIISFNTGLIILITFYAYGDTLSSIFLPALLCLIISWAVCFQYMLLYEVGLETIFICFLIDEEVNKSLDFKDENGNVLLHPKTGKPIGKMRASHRLYKLIGLKKPKIRASKKDIASIKSSARHDDGTKEDKATSGKSVRKIFMFNTNEDPSTDDQDSDDSIPSTSSKKKDDMGSRQSSGW